MFRAHRSRGQGLVEFALVIPVLLLAMLSIVEGALLFQSFLAIQHAAREAARFAVTYQPPIEYDLNQVRDLLHGRNPPPAFPEEDKESWIARRVGYIKDRAVEQSMGIRIVTIDTSRDEPPNPDSSTEVPGFFGVYVRGRPSDIQDFEWENPGGPGLPVQVHVYYRWIPLDPLLKAIVPNGIMINGQTEMINEGIQWAELTPTPSTPPATETVRPPTATPPGWTPGPVTPTATSTPIGTPTPTLTPTPGVPYILLAPEHEAWTEAGLVQGRIEIHNHFPEGTYDIWWEDNCGERTHLGMTMTTTGGTAIADMPVPSSVRRNFRYLCPPIVPGNTYQGILSTTLAETEVSIFVPVRPPDLTIDQIVVPEEISAGQAITVGVVISSSGLGVVSDTFDVDLYVNPSHTPILRGQPGQNTEGGSSPKQWYVERLPRGESAELSYVVLPPTAGDYQLWAQVDTSDYVMELDEDNNIFGPLEFTLFCSQQCDDFDPGALDPKWSLASVGSSGGTASSTVTGNGTLRLTGTGHDIQAADDGKSHMLHQGPRSGDWEMTVQVLNYPRGSQGAQAGLMVRQSASPGESLAAIAVMRYNNRPALQVWIRDQGRLASPCGTAPIPGHLFDGAKSNGEGVYLRIAREGQTLTMGTSLDGKNWSSESCMQHTFADQAMADAILPGIWFAPNDANSAQQAEYDRFRLCPPGSSAPPSVRPDPPLLRACGNVLLNSDLEPAGRLSPWLVGDNSQAVQSSSDYSADPGGQIADGYSIRFRLDDACPGGACNAWAYQEFVVPTFISSTQPVAIEMNTNLFGLVPPSTEGRTGRLEDKLWLSLKSTTGQDLTEPIVILDGGMPERGVFHRLERDMVPLFSRSNVLDHVGERVRFSLSADNTDAQGETWFYLDQIRCEVCTTVLPPDPIPDRVYRLGGRLLVILEGRPTPMSGIEVWAIQLPDGTTPPEELGVWTTTSIQDSTYNMFNLNPGRYRIYAEVWVSGNLYTAATTIQVEAGATVIDVNLNLL